MKPPHKIIYEIGSESDPVIAAIFIGFVLATVVALIVSLSIRISWGI